MKKLVPFIALMILQLSIFGQDKMFTVVAVQGKASVGGKNLAIGQQIAGDAAVLVSEASYLGVLHKSGSPVEFKTKGSYNLKTYNDKLASNGKGFQQKYMDYVVNGMTKKSDNSAYQKNMGVTGSVDRALAKRDIIVPLPEKVTLMEPSIDLEWMDEAKVPEYIVTVRNMKEEKLMSSSSMNKSAHVDLKGIELEQQQYYLVTITNKEGNRKSNTINFYIPSADEKAALTNDLADIKSSLDMNSSIGLVAYAQICEEKGLYMDALHAYRKAKELSPDVDYFNTTYKEFVDDIVAKQ